MHFLFRNLIGFLCVIQVISAGSSGYDYGVSGRFVPLKQNEQFFEQDAHGQYSYGYRVPQASKQEIRTIDGVTHGYYSFVDATGVQQAVRYLADANGFHVAATNLPNANLNVPQPVTETPEVAAARAQHLAAHEMIKLRDAMLLGGGATNALTLKTFYQPIEDTPEVAVAKAEFFKRYEDELLRHKLLSEKSVMNKSFNNVQQE